MPTRGIASTMAVLIKKMDDRLRRTGSVKTPWLVVQSEDDEVVDVAGNRRFHLRPGYPRTLPDTQPSSSIQLVRGSPLGPPASPAFK
jgi:hypothetical protein